MWRAERGIVRITKSKAYAREIRIPIIACSMHTVTDQDQVQDHRHSPQCRNRAFKPFIHIAIGIQVDRYTVYLSSLSPHITSHLCHVD